MVIDPNNRLPATSTNNARNKPAGVVTTQGQTQSDSLEKNENGTDNVQLSPEAQALKRLEAQINASPDIDIGRVAAIKRAIADGNFEINVERIAERMLQQDNLLG